MILFDIGNIICLVGTLLSIRAVIKDRSILKGYSLSGSFLTALAMLLFLSAFIELQSLISIASCLVTTGYWCLVTLYLTINKFIRRI